MSARDDILAAMQETERRAGLVTRHLAEETWRRLVEQTPVDTLEYTDSPGTTRGNWRFALDAPDETFDPGIQNTGAAPPLPDVDLVGRKYYMTNSTPWIEVLEYGLYPLTVIYGSWNRWRKQHVKKTAGGVVNPGYPDPGTGFSPQAPQGWIRLTEAAMDQVAEGMRFE